VAAARGVDGFDRRERPRPTAAPMNRVFSRVLLGLAAALALLAPLTSAAEPVELDRLDTICCPSGIDRTGDHVVASYDDPAEFLGLRVFDYADPAAPALVAELPMSEQARAVALSGAGHAYVAAGVDGLIVVDVSSFAHPFVVGSVPVVDEAIDVEVIGGRAWVVTPWSGLRVFDLAQPTLPVEVGAFTWSSIPLPYSGQRRLVDAAVAGNVVGMCFAATALSGAVVQFADFTDPAAPIPLGTSGLGSEPEWLPGCNGIGASATHFYTDHGYVSIYNPGTGGYDEGNLVLEYPGASYSEYRMVGTLPDPAMPLRSIVASGSIVHVARGDRLQTFDASQPWPSSLLSDLTLPWGLNELTLSSTGAVVVGTAGPAGLGAIGVADPSNPSVLSYEGQQLATFDRVVVDGGIAVVVDNFDGLRVVDVSNPSELVELASWPMYATQIALQGAIACVAIPLAPERVQLIDFSTPESPVERGFVAMPESPRDVEVAGGYAFVAVGASGLRIVDVSDPDAPVEVASLHPPGITREVEVRGSLALVLAEDGVSSPPVDTLTLVDVSEPTAPVELATIADLDLPMTVEMIGDHVFVFATTGMEVFDVSDPATPVPVATMPFPYVRLWGYEAVRHGSLLVVPLLKKLVVVDVSDPAAPFVAAEWLDGRNGRNVVIEGNVLYRAEISSGFASYMLGVPAVPALSGLPVALLAAAIGIGARAALRRR